MQLSRKTCKVIHPLDPIFDQYSKVLILGSMPSVKSRELGFYYSHPQNRFWKVLADVFREAIPLDNTSKKAFLLEHHIALWDVIQSCTITGSSDSSIKNIEVNDISYLLKNSSIERIFVTGRKAFSLYQKYIYPKTKLEAIYLPSTSPANASIKYDELLNQYKKIVY